MLCGCPYVLALSPMVSFQPQFSSPSRHLSRVPLLLRIANRSSMKNVACFAIIMACSLAVFAKDKTTFQIEVLVTDAWQRDVAIHHAATNGTSNTNCDTNGSVNTTTVGDYSNGSVNATTNCTTTTTPGTPGYVTHRSIQQESVHAVFPNAQHVMLWCQAGFRKCANLAPGTYTVEPDGDKAVRIYVYSIVSHKLMGKMKYRVVGSW